MFGHPDSRLCELPEVAQRIVEPPRHWERQCWALHVDARRQGSTSIVPGRWLVAPPLPFASVSAILLSVLTICSCSISING
jgi:hypothetical protein